MKRFILFCLALAALVGSLVLLGTRPNPANQPSTATPPQTCFQQLMTAEALLKLGNETRAKAGVAPLTLNTKLNAAATLKAQDMVSKHYWAHVSPTGATPWDWFDAVGYKFTYAAENLAEGRNTPEGVNAAWVGSPGHYKNMTDPNLHEVGFGASCGETGGRTGTIVVAEYGTQR